MKVKSRMSCPVRRKDGTWTTFIKEFEEDIPILVGKNLYAISVDDQIIQSVKKQFAKLGCITKQRKGLRIKPRLLFFALKGDKNE